MGRFLLPQGQMITRRFQINLRNLFHFLDERTKTAAQPEIREVAEGMLEIARGLWPNAVAAWEAGG